MEPFGLGDVITLEPLIRGLREQQIEVRISAKATWQPIFPRTAVSQWLNAPIPWSNHESSKKYHWRSFANRSFRMYLNQLRGLSAHTVGIDPRGDIRSVLLLHLAGCRRVLTLRTYLGTDLRVPRFAAEVVEYSGRLKRWEVNLLFLQALGIQNTHQLSPPCFRHLGDLTKSTVARRIGLVPVAPWSGKFWGPDKWIELIALLLKQDWQLIGLCGPGQTLLASAELGGQVPVNECVGMDAWTQELAACRCVVAVDSGPMHLADALGIPVIALFGQGKLPLWAPSGVNSCVIDHQNDSDFYLCHPTEENAHLGREFMRRIHPQEIVDAVVKTETRSGE